MLCPSALFTKWWVLALYTEDIDGSEKAETCGVPVRSAQIVEASDLIVVARRSGAEVVDFRQGSLVCDGGRRPRARLLQY